MKVTRNTVRSTSKFVNQNTEPVTVLNANIAICNGSEKIPITTSELGLNEETTLFNLQKMMKNTSTVTDRIKASFFNFRKTIGLAAVYKEELIVYNMYLNLFGNCENDFNVNTTAIEIEIWAGNLLILLIKQKKFKIAQEFFEHYLPNKINYTYQKLQIWAESSKDKDIPITFIKPLFDLARNSQEDPKYEKNNKGLMNPNHNNFNYNTNVSVLEYTGIKINEFTGQEEVKDYIFPLAIYRIKDLKKIQDIIFDVESDKVRDANNRDINNSVPKTKTDLNEYNQFKRPNLVIQVRLKTIGDIEPKPEPELEEESLPEEVSCVPNGFCIIAGGKNKRKTIKRKKVNKFALKKRKTKVLKKRKTKKEL